MNIQAISLIISEPLRVATPLILAALDELVTEKSGVLNLGIEGMMLVGAVASFVAASITGNIYLGLFIALISGIAIALMSQSTANASTYNAIVSTNNAIVSTNNAIVSTNNAIVSTNNAIVSTDNAIVSTDNAIVSTDNAIVSTNDAIVSTDNANVVIYNSIRFSQVLTLCQSKFFNLDAERLAAGYR
ncbi:MAG: hypothetical protein V7L02_13655 [Nostoc sp.]|uniref:ABC transporter permease subunit n=1 Tax=Nostoc sp. TaxID=1180 RepID=UPI002FF82969